MRITDVQATTIRIPLETVFGGSVYRIDNRCTIVVQVHTDEGIVSESYSGDERHAYREVHELVTGPLREAVIGEDPFALERVWEKMFSLTPLMRNKSAAMRAIAAVDTALWDIVGKALKVPVRVLLGGYRERLPAVRFAYYVEGRDTATMVGDLQRQRERGFGGVKLKVGGVPVPEDVARVRAIRQALGDDFIIVCDANQAWTVAEAVQFARAVEEFNLAWLEEPVRWEFALEGMRQVRQRTTIPVAAGQGESTRFGCWQLVEGEAVDILNVDASIAGGITEWRRIAAAASLKGIRMAHHEEPHIAVQLLSAIPHGLFVEVFEEARDPVYHQLNRRLPPISGGYMTAPSEPGLGLELDRQFMARYRVL
ncbi:MAG: mandelate racemase/muconate lactonizing enzyme family protein [Chloroflexi bacterium]|nr:mandelate racemase/muconate lactonizing enzyme family protein [Chloroflexota bacterium]